jgi:hypothetical protein
VKIRKALAAALSIGLAIALSFVALPVLAQNAKVEASAKALQKKAMDEDYLATEFAKAQEKLDKALAACGTDKCSAPVRAQLHRDLGVVMIGGQIDKAKGIGHFVDAIKLDPATALDPDLRTKELDAAFADAKKRAASGGAGAGAAAGAAPAGGAAGQPAGDFVHEPTEVQQIRTPIPVYVEYSGEEQLVKVIARYKGFGMTDWKTIELKKTGEKGWGALLPCADVQQGTTLYYIQGFNAANDPVAVGGDRNNAYKVKVTRDKVADPPHLPNQPAPTACADTGDCPPNFPGCKKAGPVVGPVEPVGKDGGEFCEEDSECKSKECKSSKCTDFEGASDHKFRRVWVGMSVGFDYTLVPSADEVCRTNSPDPKGPAPLQPVNSANYYCVNSNGSDYPVRPVSDAERKTEAGSQNDRIVQNTSDKVSGGGAFGNVRILAAVDYALNMNLLLGARLGLVLNTYPGQAAKDDGKSFPPVHVELRGTYLFGKDAILKKVAPFVMFGGGISTFETAVKVSVVENAFPPATGKLAKDVDAWQLAGPAFVTFGGGARIGLSERAAFMLGARVNLAFGNAFAPSAGPDVGIVFGF